MSAGTLERMVSAIPGATADDLLVLGSSGRAADRRSTVGPVSGSRHAVREPDSLARCPSEPIEQGANGAASSSGIQPAAESAAGLHRPLTIAEAKLGLGAAFGISPAMVEIRIRG